MKTKIIPIIVLAMFGFVVAETAIAEAPKTQPAQEALKGVRPFIGSWTAESDAYEGFEGNEDDGKIDMVFRFRWLQEKAAVEFNLRIIHKKPARALTPAARSCLSTPGQAVAGIRLRLLWGRLFFEHRRDGLKGRKDHLENKRVHN